MRNLVILALLGVVLVGGFAITASNDWARAQETTENVEQEDAGAEDATCASPVASLASPEASPTLAVASTPVGSPVASPVPCPVGTPVS